MLLVQEQILQKIWLSMRLFTVLGSQGIVVKRTVTIFFSTPHQVFEKKIWSHHAVYLTITLWARDFYRVIVDEGEARISYHA